jgi:hypothetical protein
MRWFALAVLVAALAGCGSQEGAGTRGQLAQLVVRVDDDGAKGAGPARELRLTCEQPTDSSACGAAAGISAADLRETPPGTACTQIYGGPEEASIEGTIRGDDVDAHFDRRDGCEIARWERVQPLLSEVR